MSEERFLKIENTLSNHDKDLHSIANSLKGINGHMSKTNDLLQEMAIKDERFSARIERVESHLITKIESNHEAIKRAHSRADKIDSIITRLAWTVITFVIVGIISAVIEFN